MKQQKIVEMSPIEHVRTHPNLYIARVDTPNHLMTELFANALDMATSGYGDKIIVTIEKDGHCSVRDFGTGFKIGTSKEDSQMYLAYSRLNSSGKFFNDFYKSALGTHGQGASVSNWLSQEFSVLTIQDGKCEHASWRRGELKEFSIEDTDEPNGTLVFWLPDDEIFDSIYTDVKYFDKMFNEICCLYPKLTIVLNDKEIHHNSIEDGLHIKNELLDNHFVYESEDINIALAYSTSDSSSVDAFVNYGKIEGGIPLTRIKSTITRLLNNFAHERGYLKDNDKNLTGTSLEEGLCLIFNVIAQNVGYTGQAKENCSKIEMSHQIQEFTNAFVLWLDMHSEDGRKIIEKAVLARKASEAAKKARASVKANRKRADKVKILHPDKLKDAEYLGEDSTLLICEGLSGGSSIAQARDTSNYGILMLRGKLINSFTNTEDRLMKNEELQLLFKALGQTPYHYDASKLRYGRVAICTDADAK